MLHTKKVSTEHWKNSYHFDIGCCLSHTWKILNIRCEEQRKINM